jgi:putative transposase
VRGLRKYFAFYNAECPHQALGYRTPELVHRSGNGGGAVIADTSARQGEAMQFI